LLAAFHAALAAFELELLLLRLALLALEFGLALGEGFLSINELVAPAARGLFSFAFDLECEFFPLHLRGALDLFHLGAGGLEDARSVGVGYAFDGARGAGKEQAETEHDQNDGADHGGNEYGELQQLGHSARCEGGIG
jgi:hypothetical protein